VHPRWVNQQQQQQRQQQQQQQQQGAHACQRCCCHLEALSVCREADKSPDLPVLPGFPCCACCRTRQGFWHRHSSTGTAQAQQHWSLPNNYRLVFVCLAAGTLWCVWPSLLHHCSCTSAPTATSSS
jgi:hypothetical protein